MMLGLNPRAGLLFLKDKKNIYYPRNIYVFNLKLVMSKQTNPNYRPGVVVHACNASTQRAEAWESEVQSQPELDGKTTQLVWMFQNHSFKGNKTIMAQKRLMTLKNTMQGISASTLNWEWGKTLEQVGREPGVLDMVTTAFTGCDTGCSEEILLSLICLFCMEWNATVGSATLYIAKRSTLAQDHSETDGNLSYAVSYGIACTPMQDLSQTKQKNPQSQG